MTVEVLYSSGCANVQATRRLVRRCVALLGLEIDVLEREGDHPSPTVLVNGRDVMGDQPPSGGACRLDVPTEERILEALRHAAVSER